MFRVVLVKDCPVHADKQIAQETGYASLFNSTRRFKSSENTTPGQYRYLYGNGRGTQVRYDRGYDGVRSVTSSAISLFGGRNEPSVVDAKNFGIYRKFNVLSEIKPLTGNRFFD